MASIFVRQGRNQKTFFQLRSIKYNNTAISADVMRLMIIHIERQIDRQTGKEIDKQIDRKIDRQIDR